MRILLILSSFVLSIFMVGCKTESITGTEFLAGTTITEYYLDATVINQEDEDALFSAKSRSEMEYIYLDTVLDIAPEIEKYDKLNIDSTNISEITACDNEYCQYVFIPLYSEGIFTNISYHYSYHEGNFCMGVGPQPQSGTDRTVKILILKIDSEMAFDVTTDLSVCPYSK